MVYHALVESRLRYSIKFWGNSYDYNFKKAFIIQKRAIRTMVRIPQWESYQEHFIKLKILTVPCLYILVLLSGFIKHPNRYESDQERVRRRDTRRKDLTNQISPKLRICQHSVRYQTVKIFNRLPKELKTINHPNIFKNRLKCFLLEKCFYSINDFMTYTM